MLCGVRGAVTVPENEAGAIREAVVRLMDTMMTQNNLAVERLVAVWFTVTPDLTTCNPARAIREARGAWASVPMLCAQEPVMADMLPRCIRVLLQWEALGEAMPPVPVYLGEAQGLRPDLCS